MKKKILSVIGATGVASVLCVMLMFSAPKTQASGMAATNIEVLEVPPSGACTGPKGASTKTCEATNTRACSDLSGCSSTSTRSL